MTRGEALLSKLSRPGRFLVLSLFISRVSFPGDGHRENTTVQPRGFEGEKKSIVSRRLQDLHRARGNTRGQNVLAEVEGERSSPDQQEIQCSHAYVYVRISNGASETPESRAIDTRPS
ncbi:hypothetical protein PUN28_009448 [Cardiocondyla obscurior]|uniref:Secreted protein n=1 Tax=Cardiocondyla obscurior TaxID=286306 RepID=A0AAW2FVF0_9HYME